ncbi:hypothetical protein ANACAC_02555 [Anaerostipes caccae L1-92]|uniref:Uncharacterized protein n=1 Tax=Anaerostipes caccae (strain DSM 14662 / CCUG 47493 / JCM 13470 / NCIMB 13811 / L1-92) TaxID=411490 RepID=B0MG45_ANACD|nr:hypothetical protein ANACAC_02555 [Anaerostipes caccae L1-92]
MTDISCAVDHRQQLLYHIMACVPSQGLFSKNLKSQEADEVLKSCCFVSNVNNLIIAPGKCQLGFFTFFSHYFAKEHSSKKSKGKSPWKMPCYQGFPKASFKI